MVLPCGDGPKSVTCYTFHPLQAVCTAANGCSSPKRGWRHSHTDRRLRIAQHADEAWLVHGGTRRRAPIRKQRKMRCPGDGKYPSDSPHPSVLRFPRQVLRPVLSRFASVARSSLGSLVWFMRVCAASRSRLSARGYCRAQGWSYATFMAWRRRLVRELAGAPLRFERRR